MLPNLRKHLLAASVAFLLEVAMDTIMFTLPADRGSAIVATLLVPGTVLQFFAGGGMSMVDGVAPEWGTDLAFGIGFLLNTALMYGCCLLLAKVVKDVSSELPSR